MEPESPDSFLKNQGLQSNQKELLKTPTLNKNSLFAFRVRFDLQQAQEGDDFAQAFQGTSTLFPPSSHQGPDYRRSVTHKEKKKRRKAESGKQDSKSEKSSDSFQSLSSEIQQTVNSKEAFSNNEPEPVEEEQKSTLSPVQELYHRQKTISQQKFLNVSFQNSGGAGDGLTRSFTSSTNHSAQMPRICKEIIDDKESLRTEIEADTEQEPSQKANEDQPYFQPPVIAVNEYYEIQITPSEDPVVLFDNGEFLDSKQKQIKKSPTFNKQSFLVKAQPSTNSMSKRTMTRSCSPGAGNIQSSFSSNSPQVPLISSGSSSQSNSTNFSFNKVYKQLDTEREQKQFLLERACQVYKEKNGCFKLQKKLEEEIKAGETDFRDQLVEILMPIMPDVLGDQFGNYLSTKLIKICSQSQLEKTMRQIQGQFCKLALSPHGTRPLQLLLQKLHFDEKISEIIFSQISPQLLRLAVDIHGNHVVQICVEKSTIEYQISFIQLLKKDFLKVALDKYGCNIFQNLFKVNTNRPLMLENFTQSIRDNFIVLIEHPFGNYIIQNFYSFGHEEQQMSVAKKLSTKFQHFATHKIASNVIECALSHQGIAQEYILQSLLTHHDTFKRILLDNFGNYVIQKALKNGKQDQKAKIAQMVEHEQAALKKQKFGKKLLQLASKVKEGGGGGNGGVRKQQTF